jgi:hypothetical protein
MQITNDVFYAIETMTYLKHILPGETDLAVLRPAFGDRRSGV